ncbi:ring-cleaving dioxygenase [Prosthecomicrobium sp. N25]|uniref:ring-cleaving dioxygenase n=1 Tax=Prosthecomicrobium sp. N25 TaxID=3129254 RepID=UPI0030776D45
MTLASPGLHHVTCIAIDPQANIDFYTKVLGLRLVKTTVNFDAPDVYHFYYGDHDGHPGTILTFFPFVYAGRGRPGNGVTETVALAVPRHALDDWMVRLSDHGVDTSAPYERMGERIVSLTDPDGLHLEVVEADFEPSPKEAIAGLHAVALRVEDPDPTIKVLTDVLGYRQTNEDAGVRRYSSASAAPGRHVDVLCSAGPKHARPGGGTVHHVAFRAKDDTQLAEWRELIAGQGFEVTPMKDRKYFHSIYFREPGGVLFEVATDPPGFTVDEAPNALGTSLKLPAQFESRRADLERRLPPVKLPHTHQADINRF